MTILACPNCKTTLTPIDEQNNLTCESCQLIYPAKDGIYLILAREIRNYKLEHPLLEALAKKAYPEKIKKYIHNTLVLVTGCKDNRTWEWGDEEFWTLQ